MRIAARGRSLPRAHWLVPLALVIALAVVGDPSGLVNSLQLRPSSLAFLGGWLLAARPPSCLGGPPAHLAARSTRRPTSWR